MAIAINGRFLTQPTTGVQRFAREITSRLESETAAKVGTFEVLIPKDVEEVPNLNIATRHIGRYSGQLWEQVDLATSVNAGIVNFCNTGPIFVRNQIVCIHDANVFEAAYSYSRTFIFYYKTILPILGRRARKIVTVSRASADLLVRHSIAPASKIEIVPNGYDHVMSWDADKSDLCSMERACRPFVFVIGSQAPHKNLALIHAIAPELDKMGLDILVSGMAADIFRSGISQDAKNVQILGYVSDNDLAWLYQNALCLLFPSFVEGFGIPLIEAMAHRCPIVSSDTSCMPEICGDLALYASPSSEQEWVTAVERLQKHGPPQSFSQVSDWLSKFRWSLSAELMSEIAQQELLRSPQIH